MSNPYQIKIKEDRGQDLNTRRKKGQMTDVVFRIENQEFKAHKLMLSMYSKHFEALFQHENHFVEGSSDAITIPQCKANIFSLILDFIYTGNIVINYENVFDLIEISSYLVLDGNLIEKCSLLLSKKLPETDLENLLEIWSVADAFNILSLKKAIFDTLNYRLDNFLMQDILDHVGFNEITEILNLQRCCVRDEKLLVDKILEWSNKNLFDKQQLSDESLDKMKEIVSKLRVDVIGRKYVRDKLQQMVGKHNLNRVPLPDKSISRKDFFRNCFQCVYIFPYANNAKEYTQLENFINPRKKSSHFAAFNPSLPPDQCLKLLPSFTDFRTSYQNYGPYAVTHSKLVNVDNLLLTIGGIRRHGKDRTLSSDVNVFNFTKNLWDFSLASRLLPRETIHMGVVYYKGLLYIFGGLVEYGEGDRVRPNFIDGQATISNFTYCGSPWKAWDRQQNPMYCNWKRLSTMNLNRFPFSYDRIEDRIYIVGEDFCDVYNITEDTWTALKNVPRGLGHRPGVVAFGNELLVFGDRPTTGANVCYSYDTLNNKWMMFDHPGYNHNVISAFLHNNVVYLFTRQSEDNTQIWIYDHVNHDWDRIIKNVSGYFESGTLVRLQLTESSFMAKAENIELS